MRRRIAPDPNISLSSGAATVSVVFAIALDFSNQKELPKDSYWRDFEQAGHVSNIEVYEAMLGGPALDL